MLAPERYAALHAVAPDLIPFLGIAIGQHLASITGLPIDFQIQHADIANEKHRGQRNPLGLRNLSNYGGDAAQP